MWLPEVGQAQGLPLLAKDLRNGHLACKDIILRKYYWRDGDEEPPVGFETLYPSTKGLPLGLPKRIAKAYTAAEKVRNIDANAYGVLLGRVLELVCEDRQAVGKSLHLKLQDLATKGEVPGKLVDVTQSLKDLRNVGAHADLGDLTPAEVPILDDLTRAILEYVYSAPTLAQSAVQSLERLRRRKKS